jgi:hypothetical protein
MKELKQPTIELATPPAEKHLNEGEIRALLKSELLNYRGLIRMGSGRIQAGDTELTPAGISLGTMLPTSEVSIFNWANTLTFSAVDHNTVQWTSGVITLANGKQYSIGAGNTGDMSTITYIYLDVAVSETALQTTITQANAVGAGKIMVAVAKNNAVTTSEAQLQVYGGSVDSLLTADNIATNTLTANEIASNTITAAEMNVSNLSSISANIGTITSGSITGVTVTAKGGSSGIDVKMNSSSGRLEFFEGSDMVGYIAADTSQNVTIDADNELRLQGDKITFDYDIDDNSRVCEWYANGSLRMKLSNGGSLSIDGTYSDGGAGFCEMFEVLDGEKLEVGDTVTTEGDKIKKCRRWENPIGSIPQKPGFIGNNQIEGLPVSFLGREWIKKDAVVGKTWIKLAEKDNLVEYLIK